MTSATATTTPTPSRITDKTVTDTKSLDSRIGAMCLTPEWAGTSTNGPRNHSKLIMLVAEIRTTTRRTPITLIKAKPSLEQLDPHEMDQRGNPTRSHRTPQMNRRREEYPPSLRRMRTHPILMIELKSKYQSTTKMTRRKTECLQCEH
jgi:hypothetical protein